MDRKLLDYVVYTEGMAMGIMRTTDADGWAKVQGFNIPIIPQLIVERIHEDAILPKYAKDGDSGMDVYSTENVLLRPQEKVLIPLGLLFQVPKHPLHELGYRWGMTLRPRSGLTAKTNIEAFLGTIDNTYRDEVKVIVKNDAQRAFDVDDERDDTNALTYVRMKEESQDWAHDLSGHCVTGSELWELGLDNWGLPAGTLLIRKGDRIAQLALEQVVRPMEIIEGTVNRDDSRGGGFGHTGVQG